MREIEFILGFPGIAKNYVQLLSSILQAEAPGVGCMLETDMRQGDIKLWNNGEVEESPEKLGIPMPVAFGPVLAFMETSYDRARKEYFDMLDDHVGELLSGSREFMSILR